jgi:hypothetical protein
MKTVVAALGSFVLFVGLIVFANEFEIFGIKFWGSRKANAQREVFEQTQSYVEGKRQEVTKYRYEYLKAKDRDEKEAIKATLRSSLANFDKTKLDADLRSFLDSVAN